MVGPLESSGKGLNSGESVSPKWNTEESVNLKKNTDINFSSKVNEMSSEFDLTAKQQKQVIMKLPIRHQKTEMEAESQTDFAPLRPMPPLVPTQFSLDGMNANFDPNLMFVPEETDDGMLQDFSITG